MRLMPACVVLVVLWACAYAQDVIDRMAAVVNRRVIMESELDQDLRVQLLLQGKLLSAENQDQARRQAVLERLIDQALLDQQIGHPEMLNPTSEELAVRVKEVRDQIAPASSDEEWNARLADYGLTQRDLEAHLTSEIRILRLVDLRFRGLVHIDKTSIAGYYQNKLIPELRRKGAPVPPLSNVSDAIEKILVEQNMGAMLDEWLQTLRAQAHIEKMISPVVSEAAGAKP